MLKSPWFRDQGPSIPCLSLGREMHLWTTHPGSPAGEVTRKCNYHRQQRTEVRRERATTAGEPTRKGRYNSGFSLAAAFQVGVLVHSAIGPQAPSTMLPQSLSPKSTSWPSAATPVLVVTSALQPARKENTGKEQAPLPLRILPRSWTCHFYYHSIVHNVVIEPHLVAREAGKCSFYSGYMQGSYRGRENSYRRPVVSVPETVRQLPVQALGL